MTPLSAAPVAHPLAVGRRLDAHVGREIRRTMELRHCKWDAQVGDVAALASVPLLVSAAAWQDLAQLAERLFAETLAVERELVARPALHRTLGLPAVLRQLFARGEPTPGAARVMRFDFHYTVEGWRVSEVNSDVPGGFTEATNFTRLVAAHVPRARPTGDPSGALADAIAGAVPHGRVALTDPPWHMEDHQVVVHLAAQLAARGIDAQLVSLHQLQWRAGRAHLAGAPVDAIVRFYLVEWLACVPRATGWTALFVDGATPVNNPGTAALTESKRLPLVWDELRAALPTWRQLLPETRAIRDAPWAGDDGWLLKAAFGNTGETVIARDQVTPERWARCAWSARLRPSRWLAQRRFATVPVFDEHGALYPCIGVYVVDGRAAGAYARVARGPVIDAHAQDIALLVEDAA